MTDKTDVRVEILEGNQKEIQASLLEATGSLKAIHKRLDRDMLSKEDFKEQLDNNLNAWAVDALKRVFWIALTGLVAGAVGLVYKTWEG